MRKSIMLAFALVAGLTTAIYLNVTAAEAGDETCTGDTSRCITKANGDVIWGDYSSREVIQK